MSEERVKSCLAKQASAASFEPAYTSTKADISRYWMHLAAFIFAFALFSTITLESIDKDKR